TDAQATEKDRHAVVALRPGLVQELRQGFTVDDFTQAVAILPAKRIRVRSGGGGAPARAGGTPPRRPPPPRPQRHPADEGRDDPSPARPAKSQRSLGRRA